MAHMKNCNRFLFIVLCLALQYFIISDTPALALFSSCGTAGSGSGGRGSETSEECTNCPIPLTVTVCVGWAGNCVCCQDIQCPGSGPGGFLN
jgi:hypothetical protein